MKMNVVVIYIYVYLQNIMDKKNVVEGYLQEAMI